MTKDRVVCKTVLIDDDVKSRKLLAKLLGNYSQVEIVGTAETMTSALKVIKEKTPDSIFLDVEKNYDGNFDLLNNISSDIKVIFVSSNLNVALKAFEVNALDFIKKPIEEEKLGRAVNRLIDDLALGSVEMLKTFKDKKDSFNDDTESNGNPLKNTLSNKGKNSLKLEYDDRLFLTKNGSSKFVKVNSILSITANKDYSYINSLDEKKIILLRTMKEWEKRLPDKYFARIHRSTIVNLEYIDKVEKWFNYSYHVHIKGVEQPFQMSRRYASKLKEKFK